VQERFKLELPASQIEILTPPCTHVSEAALALAQARHALAARTAGLVQFAAAGVHPFSSGDGVLNELGRYRHTIDEYGLLARRQLVCAFQVHVSVGESDRALAVYNAARSYLPLLAALAANAPFYEGVDTGLASIRAKLSELLPRQGIPPAIESWESYVETFRWGVAAGGFPDAHSWWWELRMHPRYGTLEFRVPDGQSAVTDAAAIAAVVQTLVMWLGERHDDGERLSVAPRWRIEENRWSACRYGVEGAMADLRTGATRTTRAWLGELLDALEPFAARVDALSAFEHAYGMVETNGAITQRRIAAADGQRGLARWLCERFLAPLPG
jgi:carboxylate-amine ligase